MSNSPGRENAPALLHYRPWRGTLGSPNAAVWHMHFRNIEERIDRLEKTVGAAVDLLHAMLHPDKANKPGTPVGR